MRSSIHFYLNGVKKELSGEQLFLPLSSYLRYEQQLTGTKVVCAEGDCGACTVLIAKYNPKNSESKYTSINSCIAPTFSIDGAYLVTIEGLNKTDELNEVQCSMVRNFGAQCGFCTPGFVMSITNMLEVKNNPNEQNVKNYLTGNLCRCTGYKSIITAALDVDINKHKKLNAESNLNLKSQMNKSVLVSSNNQELFAPITITEAIGYRIKNPTAIIFSGATDLGVQINKGHLQPVKILSLHLICELYEKTINDNIVSIGARVTLTELQKFIADKIPKLDEFLNIFASPQIKNSATLVGNIANASPIADTTPLMMALDAQVIICGADGKKTIALNEFYLGYKKMNLQTNEIITHIQFKVPTQGNKFENYKVSQRRDLDISTVNASFNFQIENNMYKSLRIALGGVAATTVRLTAIENAFVGKENSLKNINLIKKEIFNFIHPLTDLRGSADYRKVLVNNVFEKYAKEHLLI